MNRRDALKLSAVGTTFLLLTQHPMANMLNLGPLTLREAFGRDFKFGVATAAYQIEGAWNLDGKGPSIWDTFSHKKGKILNGDNGDVSCDFYHNFSQDLALLQSMNMDVFRFSTAWSRIMPEGQGPLNIKGIDFYHRVIDRCLALGIEPWLTCYHWDLPQALQDEGGWFNRDSIAWFSDFVEVLAKYYGDKVKHWMVFNEPMAFTGLGYMSGGHAPGIRSFKQFKAAVHHVTVAQGEGGRILKELLPDASVGTTFSCTAVEPKSNAPRHQKAAKKADALFNRLFIEPAMGMGYPTEDLSMIQGIERWVKDGDMERATFDFDFIGLQNYFRSVARFSFWPPVFWANLVKANKLTKEENITEMGWEVSPEGMYHVLKQFGEYGKRIIVTENGAAFEDHVEGNFVHDSRRLDFYKQYIGQVLRAKREGIPIDGYFAWTFLDNFEWAEGYHPRFGIVHVDFENQERLIKDSGLWFKEQLR